MSAATVTSTGRVNLSVRISNLLDGLGAWSGTAAGRAYSLISADRDFDRKSPTWLRFLAAFNCALNLCEIAISERGQGEKLKAVQSVIEAVQSSLRAGQGGQDKAPLRLPMTEFEKDAVIEQIGCAMGAFETLLGVLNRTDGPAAEEQETNVIRFASWQTRKHEPSPLEPEPVA